MRILPEEVSRMGHAPSMPTTFENIFLTGATGTLGGCLLKEFLKSTQARIYCLVRAESKERGRERLKQFLSVYDPRGRYLEEFHRRVVPVLGDIQHESFHLTHREYVGLAGKIDVTYHVAASTNLFSNYRTIAPINVGGTQHVIQFCLKTAQKYLCHFSTYAVMGDKAFDSSIVFSETDLDIGQGFKQMAYQESKFQGEKLVREATRRGLVWNIFRPGQIYGDSRYGYYPQGQTNLGGLFYDIFKTTLETRTTAYSRRHYDITPVDYVSKAAVYLGLVRKAYFETYHLTNPDIRRYYEIMDLLQRLGYDIRVVDIQEYRDMILGNKLCCGGQPYQSVTTKAFRYWFQKNQFNFSDSAITDCTYTRSVLEPAHIVCPKIDLRLMKTYINYGIKQNYFPRPDRVVQRRGI